MVIFEGVTLIYLYNVPLRPHGVYCQHEPQWGDIFSDVYPSAIKSYTIGPILEQGFAVLGRFGLVGRMEKFLKRRNFC